jgi:3-oxoacyl-[acyl-carrier-protein] synthase I
MAPPPVKAISWNGNDICLCGVGARTPLGMNAAATAAAVRAGISGISIHPRFVDRNGEPIAIAGDSQLDQDVALPERLAQMLESALVEATADAPLLGEAHGLGCWLGLPEKRVGIVDSAIDNACQGTLRALGFPPAQVLPRGNAAGLIALQAAAQAISRGEVELALVASADSYHDDRTLMALDSRGWLMSALNRNGFPPGEAAGACLLASRSMAARMGLPKRGEVTAASTAIEPISIHNTEGVCVGTGLTAVIKEVTAASSASRDLVTATYCDLNGQRYRNEEFMYALLRTQEAFVDAHDYLCPADCWGDVGAACGPLFVALAVEAAGRGYSKGPRPLLWTGSESGYRSAVLLEFRP